MKSLKISCIMPAYNAGKYIRVAIDSILNQTYKNFELIIINDGSSDNTEEIILSYNDPRIVYIKNEKNIKLIKTLNKGIDVAKGEFISRMDSDDQALPSLFEEELREFALHPDAGIVNTMTYHMDEEGNNIRPNRQMFRLSPEICSIVCFYANHISHPGVMVKSHLMKTYKYKDDGSAIHFEDCELWCRMFADGIKCYTTEERLLNYRNTPTSINSLYGNQRNNLMQAFYVSYLKNRWGYDWGPLPIICSFRDYRKHFMALLKLWSYLKNKSFINRHLYLKLLKWQFHYFSGIFKRLIFNN